MYTISHGSAILYNPALDGFPLVSPKLQLEANKIGTLAFTVYPQNPEYGQIQVLLSELTVYKDGNVYWQGRPNHTKRTFKGGIEYKCEEVTAFLNDYKLRPGTYEGTCAQFFSVVLTAYNARTSKQISIGRVTVSGNVSAEIKDYPGGYDALKKYLVDAFGGYLVPRYESGNIYLDYLAESDLPAASQAIRFGENLTDLFIETSGDSAFSILIPLGPETDGAKMTVKSVNGGKDYIENTSAAFHREITHDFADAETPQALLTAAQQYLAANALHFRETVTLTAIDLHNANADITSFGFLQKIRTESIPHNLSSVYVSSRAEIPLDKPINEKLSLGATRETLVESVNRSERAVTMTTETANTAANTANNAVEKINTVVGGATSSALFRVYTDAATGTKYCKLNPEYRLLVGSYDVESKLGEI